MLDDDIHTELRDLARHRGAAIGEVASQLLRRALHPDPVIVLERGVPVFRRTPGSAEVSLETVLAAEDDE